MTELDARGANLAIMIPTYNCAALLAETLRSLQEQGSAVSEARIVVVDDCSTKDDPKAVIDAEWPGRVEFFRHPQNVGLVRNFNHCFEHAGRDWIHILHGDDYVLPGAYESFAEATTQSREPLAVFARCLVVDGASRPVGVTPLLGDGWVGELAYEPMQWRTNPVQFAGILLSAGAAGAVGAFDGAFEHVADWNLWWRIARTGGASYSNRLVGAYRTFEGNHTSTLTRSGRNMAEYLEQVRRLEQSERQRTASASLAWATYAPAFDAAIAQCWRMRDDPVAFAANLRVLSKFPARGTDRRRVYSMWLSHFKRLAASALRAQARATSLRGKAAAQRAATHR